MTRSKTLVWVAMSAALAVGAGAALAQQGPGRGGMGPGGMGPGMMGPGMGHGMGQGWGMGPGMHRGMMGYGMMRGGCPMFGAGDGRSYAEGRLAFIRAELGVTDEQKAAWEGYAGAFRTSLETMQSMHATMMSAAGEGSPVERLDRHMTAMEARLATLKEVRPALATLYDALSDEQKAKADDVLTGMGCM